LNGFLSEELDFANKNVKIMQETLKYDIIKIKRGKNEQTSDIGQSVTQAPGIDEIDHGRFFS
jgi:NADH dehydrogenase FAD-containing subunit